MKKSKFTEEQMVRILREADATSTAEAAKKHGISDQTIYVWRKKVSAARAPSPRDALVTPAEPGQLSQLPN